MDVSLWWMITLAGLSAMLWAGWISRGGRRPVAFTAGGSAGVVAVLLIPALAMAADGGAAAQDPIVGWLAESVPVFLLLAVVAVVLLRLPRIELGHSDGYRKRRVLNWLPLGLTYAFLYMGRYNLTVSKSAFQKMQDAGGGALMGNDDFGIIFMVGTVVYGVSFLINGPLTDRYGGKLAILVGAGGAAVANLVMGLATWSLLNDGPGAELVAAHFTVVFSLLYAGNMYFQSFGAVAIVKVNAPWFHVRERGVFGAIFGILISLGIYFAFDWGKLIKDNLGLMWVFLVPAILLAVFWILDVFMVQNTPGEAGHDDFDTADASSGDDGPRLPVAQVFAKMLKNPIILTIAFIEFCSGFLRQAIMQWYRAFAEQTDVLLGLKSSFVYDNWGLLLCCAGILGGVVAGVISDRVFDSRRGPVAGFLYAAMLVGALVMTFTYDHAMVSWLVIIMSMCVIGVHGMLSGTASMDFGGKKNVGVAVGIIDGFVYLGTGVMSLTYGIALPQEEVLSLDYSPIFDLKMIVGPATEPSSWIVWPLAMVPMALIGFLLALRVWNAKPKPKAKSS
jgi:OPA family glycerol-3-phosphate transporter-like MFS transporter